MDQELAVEALDPALDQSAMCMTSGTMAVAVHLLVLPVLPVDHCLRSMRLRRRERTDGWIACLLPPHISRGLQRAEERVGRAPRLLRVAGRARALAPQLWERSRLEDLQRSRLAVRHL